MSATLSPARSSVFIVIEGPNGVGKSTIAKVLADRLRRELDDVEVLDTKEPSASRLGTTIRAMEGELEGLALGMACAADRLDHVRREIRPALDAGVWVVCDRYVASSLVLQRLDGLEAGLIWAINETVPAPDLTVYLENDSEVIKARLHARSNRSRFETVGTPARELEFYSDARAFLGGHGWPGVVVDCASRSPEDVAGEIAAAAQA